MTRKPRQKAAKTSTSQLQSATARLKLKPQTRAYFVKVADATWVGYRKPLAGPGAWVARVGVGEGGKGWEKTLWTADDNSLKADGEKVLTFWQARSEVQKLTGRKPNIDAAGNDKGAAITVDEALTAYEPELRRRGAAVRNARLPRQHLSAVLLAKPVTLVTEQELEGFRDGMFAKGLAASTVNRVMNCLRAALTQADKSRTHIWRSGLKALPDATEANNVVIDDEAKAQQWVAEAYALDHHLGLLTHTIAESGARPSQPVRLRIRDLISTDPNMPRLMMPKSGKGGTRNRAQRKLERYPVSISPGLAALLKAAAKGRPEHAPLLLRKNGEPWSEDDACSQYTRDVRAIVEKIGLDPDVYGLMAFRHTSITRMLCKGTPTEVVAKSHDTSEQMIRKHYAASILNHSDALTRKTLPSFGPASEPPQSNVVALKR